MKFMKKTDIIIVSVILIISAIAYVSYHYVFNQKAAKAEFIISHSLFRPSI